MKLAVKLFSAPVKIVKIVWKSDFNLTKFFLWNNLKKANKMARLSRKTIHPRQIRFPHVHLEREHAYREGGGRDTDSEVRGWQVVETLL